MESSIVPSESPLQFSFEDHDIRIVADENSEPVFVAADVCRVLGIANTAQALGRIDDDEKGVCQIYTLGGLQKVAVVNEMGLYSLILKSDKPAAKKFKRWIVHEVLPSIRKTGSYAIEKPTPIQLLRQMFAAFDAQQAQIENLDERVTSLESHVQGEVEYFTVMGYCRKHGITPPTLEQAKSYGLRAAHSSRAKGYGIGKTSDPRFGEVNTYHIDILREVIK